MFGVYCSTCPRQLLDDTGGLLRVRVTRPEYEAVIDEVLVPGRRWRVRYRGSFWQACSSRLNAQFHPRQIVRVIGRQNLTLIIVPMEERLAS